MELMPAVLFLCVALVISAIVLTSGLHAIAREVHALRDELHRSWRKY